MLRPLSLLLGAIGAVAGAGLWWRLAQEIPPPSGGSSIAFRLGITLAWLLPALSVLWVMLLTQMAARFLAGAFDPLAGGDRPFLRTNQRVITNTVEHMAVFAPALLALAAGMDGPQMPEVAALAMVFAIARITFWAGYLVAPMGRALGMAATLAVTAAALGGAMAIWSGVPLPG